MWEQGSVGGPWQVSMDELMDKNLPYFVKGNLATLMPSIMRSDNGNSVSRRNDPGGVRVSGAGVYGIWSYLYEKS